MDTTQIDVLYALIAGAREAIANGSPESANRLLYAMECVMSHCGIEDEPVDNNES